MVLPFAKPDRQHGSCLSGYDQFFVRRHNPKLHATGVGLNRRLAFRHGICRRIEHDA